MSAYVSTVFYFSQHAFEINAKSKTLKQPWNVSTV